MPSDVRFPEVKRLFSKYGWYLARVAGSHHIFKSPTGQACPVPVHHGMVKYAYYRAIKKFLGES